MTESINYVTTQGERWDSLAWKFYGSVKSMNILIDANPAIALSGVLDAGTKVIVPIVEATSETITASNLPPWKR